MTLAPGAFPEWRGLWYQGDHEWLRWRSKHFCHGSFWLSVELAGALGLASSWIQWSGGWAAKRSRQGTVNSISPVVVVKVEPMVTSESRRSSFLIWYRIFPSSSKIFWVRWRQLSHPDGEVSGGISYMDTGPNTVPAEMNQHSASRVGHFPDCNGGNVGGDGVRERLVLAASLHWLVNYQ